MNTKEENDICSRLQTYIMELIDNELKKRKCSVNKFCEYSGIKRVYYYVVKRDDSSISLTFIVRAAICLNIPLSDFFKLPEWETKEHSYTRVNILVPKNCSIQEFFSLIKDCENNNQVSSLNSELVKVKESNIDTLVNNYIDLFADRLKMILKKHNMTLTTCIELSGISMPHFYKITNSHHIPTLKTLAKIMNTVPFYPPILFSTPISNIKNIPKGYINVCKLAPTNIESLIEMFYD